MRPIHRLAFVAMFASCAVLTAPLAGSRAGTLVFNADTSDPNPKAAFQAAVKKFEAENPDIKVTFNIYDHESYKSSIRNWLTSSPPDVALWYSGERMRQFVKPGLLEDVSSLWTDAEKKEFGPKAVAAVTVDGRQYGVPYSYYQWGIYYRADLLEKAGVATPIKDWDGLLTACDKLKAAGFDPIDIGTKELWTTGGWFDYLDLRINGYDFHKALMAGQVSWEDPKVRAVFAHWRELLDRGCFVKNHTSLSWQESQSLLYQGRAAMMLIGNFITQGFPPEIADKMAFMPFPVVTPGVARAEEAPTESIHIPSGAKNKADAMKFLAFMMRADVQADINRVEHQLPANVAAAVSDDQYLKAGAALLNDASGTTQFIDRDTSEDLATIAMKGFQEFMVKPDRLDQVLATIEKARKRIYPAS